jgi:hypothetical protein
LPAQHESPAAALVRLVNGFKVSQAIYVAATLGIADILAAGPRTSDELAAETEADPRPAQCGSSGEAERSEHARRAGATPTASGLSVFEGEPD